MFKHIFLCGAAATLLSATVQAADIAAPPETFDWSGFYVGASAGYSWSDAEFDIDPTGEWADFPDSAASIEDATEGTLNPQGFIGGLKLGWNTQLDSWVFGVEADISYVDAKDDEDGGPIDLTSIGSSHNEAELSWLSTLRARAGIALDRALIYATGGLALGDWDVEASMQAAGPARFDESEWRVGWVVGGGIEYAIDDAWSVNAEYLYADFGHISGDSAFEPPSLPTFTHDHEVELTTQIVRGGISYRFPY